MQKLTKLSFAMFNNVLGHPLGEHLGHLNSYCVQLPMFLVLVITPSTKGQLAFSHLLIADKFSIGEK